jgi:hypothetical protein
LKTHNPSFLKRGEGRLLKIKNSIEIVCEKGYSQDIREKNYMGGEIPQVCPYYIY